MSNHGKVTSLVCYNIEHFTNIFLSTSNPFTKVHNFRDSVVNIVQTAL